MICGLYAATAGTGTIMGHTLAESSKERDRIRSIIGYCPQKDVCIDELTVGEHLRLVAMIKGCTDSVEIDRECEFLGLVPYLDKYPPQLSGGTKRRLMIGANTCDLFFLYLI